MGAPRHGKNGLIYISGTEVLGANSWSLSVPSDSAETPRLGQTWKNNVKGMRGWSGSISAWDMDDANIISDAANYDGTVILLIYPNRAQATEYYHGNAIFGMSAGGGVSAPVTQDGDFVGDGALGEFGWS